MIMLQCIAVTIAVLFAIEAPAKTASEVFDLASKSTVVILAYDNKGETEGFGSGVVLPDGSIATNCHVIGGATSMQVLYQQKKYPANLRQSDWDHDVCILNLNAITAPPVTPVTMGSTNRLKVGAKVYAIGAPQGLELTLSEGIISSLRSVEGGQYLQITAPISPGSSGGGLFDDEGRLIGLPTFYLTEGQQLNFAVPVEWILAAQQEEIQHLPGIELIPFEEAPKQDQIGDELEALEQIPEKPSKKIPTTEWLNKALALHDKKDWPRLIKHALRWTKAEPKEAEAWVILGVAYGQSKQITKAIEALQQASRINPENATAWYNLGTAYGQSEQTNKAIEALQQALRINPEDARAWTQLGISYEQSGQTAKAIEALQQALRINPEDAMAWYNLGTAYGQSEQTNKAIEALQQALRINPENAKVWNNLGTAYLNSQQTSKAVEAYQQAIRIRPDNTEAWYYLGLGYYRQGHSSQVTEVYKRLKTLDPVIADDFFNKVVLP